MLSPHLCSVLEKLQPSYSLVKGQHGLRENISLSCMHILLPVFPSVFHCCLTVALPFLPLILPVDVLNRCQEGFGGRTLAIKPSCCITTGAGKGGGDGGGKKGGPEHNSKIPHTNGNEMKYPPRLYRVT